MINPKHLELTGVEVTSNQGMLGHTPGLTGTILFSNLSDLMGYDYLVVADSIYGHQASDLPPEYRALIPGNRNCWYYRKNEVTFVYDDGLDNWI